MLLMVLFYPSLEHKSKYLKLSTIAQDSIHWAFFQAKIWKKFLWQYSKAKQKQQEI